MKDVLELRAQHWVARREVFTVSRAPCRRLAGCVHSGASPGWLAWSLESCGMHSKLHRRCNCTTSCTPACLLPPLPLAPCLCLPPPTVDPPTRFPPSPALSNFTPTPTPTANSSPTAPSSFPPRRPRSWRTSAARRRRSWASWMCPSWAWRRCPARSCCRRWPPSGPRRWSCSRVGAGCEGRVLGWVVGGRWVATVETAQCRIIPDSQLSHCRSSDNPAHPPLCLPRSLQEQRRGLGCGARQGRGCGRRQVLRLPGRVRGGAHRGGGGHRVWQVRLVLF